MSTYVIVDIDYWGGSPVPKIIYAGQDFEKAKAKFRELFDCIAVKNGKCINIPSQYWPYIGKDLAKEPEYIVREPTPDEVFERVMQVFDGKGRVDLNTEWVDDYDEPFCVRFERRNDD